MPGRRSLQARLARSARKLREARGWTQEAAAEKAHMNARHYQKVEEGAVNVTLRTLGQLCRAFAVDIEALFHD